jgi:hypothetical protein
MLSVAKRRSLLEDLAVIGTKHLLFLLENKQKADPSPLRMTRLEAFSAACSAVPGKPEGVP